MAPKAGPTERKSFLPKPLEKEEAAEQQTEQHPVSFLGWLGFISFVVRVGVTTSA